MQAEQSAAVALAVNAAAVGAAVVGESLNSSLHGRITCCPFSQQWRLHHVSETVEPLFTLFRADRNVWFLYKYMVSWVSL